MSSFSSSQLEKKLKVLTMSQQSIQTLSLWCIHHRKHSKKVVQTWFKELQRVKPQRKLIFVYLANDVLQNSRRKGTEYNKDFGTILPNALMHCAEHCDEKTIESLKRILSIWLERNVYNETMIARMSSCLENKLGFEDEISTTPPIEQIPTETKENMQINEVKKLSVPPPPPQPDELVKRLQELENSATQDAVVREKIANLPIEVTNPSYIEKVDDLASAKMLQDKIDQACELLADYNARLANEQKDRQIAQKMLQEYTASQKYELAIAGEKLVEYEAKLKKVNAVKQELQSHLENLPDMSKLPDPIPLPSPGDLFSPGKLK
ncbi:regulation of nuclear pre-mRNA domain-containing protein 1A isoform X3 [Hydra vulgaris]|uniref:Regulation of nuclear pre-mRNA domain-containing protein 1A isoform X3 n=1 Tax=Hydra vulgaris TaxID=6087 RepID=A0ABM4DEF7_HYDVU